MDSFSSLSDDLLLKILSFAPIKDAVKTMFLSKQWSSVWKYLTKLEYVDTNTENAIRFINKFLELHEAPVLQTMHLTLGANVPQVETEKWISAAISRHVRNLKFVQYRPSLGLLNLPKSLYTCQSLVNFHLHEAEITDVPSEINLPFLKNLSLILVRFSTKEVFSKLVSSCPVLEELVLCRAWNDDVNTFKIVVPCLQRLVIFDIKEDYPHEVAQNDVVFEFNTPCLKSLKIFDRISKFCSLVKMPELVEAKIDLKEGDPKQLLGCLTSAKHLSLCLKPQPDNYLTEDFNQLVSLELCTTCASDWLDFMFRHSPNLQTLRFKKKCCSSSNSLEAT